MTLITGIDEAGRGPVIGPMIIVGTIIDKKDLPKLEAINVRDSKLLTPKQRSFLASKIKKILKYRIIKLSPQLIDDALNSHELNLNKLEAIKMASLINTLKPDEAFLDCPSNNIASFRNFLMQHLTHKAKISLFHNAECFPIVAAASIIAKTERDREIEIIKKKYSIEFNSGYPSDPATIDFLKKNWDKYPDIFRKSWESYKKVASKKGQSTLDSF